MSLSKLFSLLENNDPFVYEEQGDFLFAEPPPRRYEQADIDIISGLYSGGFNLCGESARLLFELSEDAFSAFVHAWMSELPIENEILSFGRKVIAASVTGGSKTAKKQAAEKAASDHSGADTLAVMGAAYKVERELHRLIGLLRFTPTDDGVYIARCTPDHLVLPAFGEHFTARFRETAWAIIDEKRNLAISRKPGEQAAMFALTEAFTGGSDEWEDLWRHYHKTINNESRKNPNLQRQLMPKRYWKYLPEM
ncbi:MAG: TIGR03915 family putative DNA repair protein [Treponema sp.]|jgi:probable DNA metabolism protein|nr:TIGR03915 family putative DNA repair protein [Treponema sp.]